MKSNQPDNVAITRHDEETAARPAGLSFEIHCIKNPLFVGIDLGKTISHSFLVQVKVMPDGRKLVVKAGPVRLVHFVLKSVWFHQIGTGEKNVEYRAITPRWKTILDKNPNVACFSRGYNRRNRIFRAIEKIDIGPCPIPGWTGDYFRIHLIPEANTFI